jgi:hypothetical protein
MKNDQATVESKNNHIVRRYDTGEQLTLLNQLWPLVNMKLNRPIATPKKTRESSARKQSPPSSDI